MAKRALGFAVTADAGDAIAEFDKLAKAIEGITPETQGVVKIMGDLDRALKAMAGAENSPKRLATATGLAKFQLDELRKSLDAAGISGAKVPAEIAKAMEQAAEKIGVAGKRSAEMRDAVQDAGKASKTAALGFESLTGAAGSLEGMLGQLKAQGGSTREGLAQLGFGVLAVGAAFKAGRAMGEDFREFLDTAFGPSFLNYSKAVAEGIVRTKEYGDLFGALPGRINGARAAQQAHTKALWESQDALKAAGVTYESDAKAKERLIKQLNATVDMLGKSEKAGESFERSLDPKPILALADALQRQHIGLDGLPPLFQKAVAAAAAMELADEKLITAKQKIAEGLEKEKRWIDEVVERQKFVTGSTDEETRSVLENIKADLASVDAKGHKISALEQEKKWIDAVVAAQKAAVLDPARDKAPVWKNVQVPQEVIDSVLKFGNALKQVYGEMDATRRAIDGLHPAFDAAGVSADQFGVNLMKLQGGADGAGGSLNTMSIIYTQWIEASASAKAALDAWIESLGREKEAMKESLEAYPKAIDQLALLKESFEQGSLSLDAMVRILQMTIDQLTAMAMRAGPKAREELNKLIETYQKFKQDAMNGPTPGSTLDQMREKGII